MGVDTSVIICAFLPSGPTGLPILRRLFEYLLAYAYCFSILLPQKEKKRPSSYDKGAEDPKKDSHRLVW